MRATELSPQTRKVLFGYLTDIHAVCKKAGSPDPMCDFITKFAAQGKIQFLVPNISQEEQQAVIQFLGALKKQYESRLSIQLEFEEVVTNAEKLLEQQLASKEKNQNTLDTTNDKNAVASTTRQIQFYLRDQTDKQCSKVINVEEGTTVLNLTRLAVSLYLPHFTGNGIPLKLVLSVATGAWDMLGDHPQKKLKDFNEISKTEITKIPMRTLLLSCDKCPEHQHNNLKHDQRQSESDNRGSNEKQAMR